MLRLVDNQLRGMKEVGNETPGTSESLHNPEREDLGVKNALIMSSVPHFLTDTLAHWLYLTFKKLEIASIVLLPPYSTMGLIAPSF